MVPSRGLTVLAAVALGVVAGAAAYSGVGSAEQNAFRGEKLLSVYVVQGTVPVGEAAATAYDDGLITSTQMPLRYVPAGAVTDLGSIGGRVARSSLGRGEVVVQGMFVSASTNPGRPAAALPAGDVAVTVSVDPSAGVAGLVQPGDQVDILVDIDGTEEAYLYQSVPVLAVDTQLVPTPDTTPGQAPTSAQNGARTLVTFAMSPAAAAHIPPTDSDGSGFTQGVYLALDGPGTPDTSVTVVNGATLIPGLHLTFGGAPVVPANPSGTAGATGSTGAGSTGAASAELGSGTGITPPLNLTGPEHPEGDGDDDTP